MAHDLSIETVYQDKSLGEKQPLWRNFFVGRQITNRFGFIDIKREKAIADDILTQVDRLSRRRHRRRRDGEAALRRRAPGHRHRPRHAFQRRPDRARRADRRRWRSRRCARSSTSSRSIKASGRACVYIEHNLAHVHEVADRLVILDRGEIVADIAPKDMSVTELTEFLIELQKKH